MNTEALSITIYGLPGTAEYQGAEWLRNTIRSAALPADHGTISIHTDLYFTGQKREQIDILLHVHFPDGFIRRVRPPGWPETVEVTFQDIIAVVEVKAHGRDKVDLLGTNARVLYRDGWKSASSQSNAQIHSVKQFIRHQLGWTPYVCNLLLFSNLVKADFPSQPNNYLASDSTCDDLLEKLCLSRRLNVSGTRSGKVPFYCTSTQVAAKIAERHGQLQELLGNYRNEVRYQPPPVRRWPSLPVYRRKSALLQSIDSRRIFHRGLPRPIWLLAVGIVLLITLGSLLSWYVRMTSPHTPKSTISYTRVSSSTLDTCTFITPSCVCREKEVFHRGATVSIRFADRQRTPVSEIVRDPHGKFIPLSFHAVRTIPSSIHGSCFVAKYPIGSRATPGFYAVQVASRSKTTSSESVLSRGFAVTR